MKDRLGKGRPSGLIVSGQFTLRGLTAMTFSVAEILGGICFKILIVLSFNPYALNYCILICCIFSCTEEHALASARASAI